MQGAGDGHQRRLVTISVLLLLVHASVASSSVTASSDNNNSSSSSSSSSSSINRTVVPEAEATISWITQHGGQVNVVVRNTPDAGRAVFAPQPFKAGDILTVIPLELVYQASTDDDADVQFTAMKLLEDLANPDHPHQQYFVSLPPRDGVWSLHDIPKAYLPLIQSKEGALEKAISGFQDRLKQLWDTVNAAKALPGTYDDLKFATAQLVTRLHQFPGTGLLMIPLVDMGNHRNDCSNTHLIEPCPSAPEKQCIIWRAAHDIPEGDEVCNYYKYMFNDRSLLQYGFLQSGPVAHQLSGVDRHDFNTSQPWQDRHSGEQGPMLFEGAPAEIRAEVQRLTALKAALQAKDLELKGIKADPADSGGWFLAQLWQWRQQRQQAIDKELHRLQRQLSRLEQLESDHGSIAAKHDVSEGLTHWLQENGAQVNVELRQINGAASPPSLISSPSPDKAGSVPAAPAAPTGTSSIDTEICASGLLNETTSVDTIEHAVMPATRTGVFAWSAVKKGDTLAIIPLHLTQQIKEGNDGFLDTVVKLLLKVSGWTQPAPTQMPRTPEPPATVLHLSLNATTQSPFLAALPKLGTIQSLHNFPEEYLRLVNNKPMELHIRALQAMLRKGWDTHRPVIEAVDDSLTFRELQHMASLVNTRALAYEEGLLLVPLLSMTSPHLSNGCVHYDYIDECPDSVSVHSNVTAGNKCVHWVAGSDVAAGDEVCISYNHLTPDHSVLQYGSIQQQETPASLHAMDRHNFNPEQPFLPASLGPEAPEPFSGSKEEALIEAARLSVILANLTIERSYNMPQQQPGPSDPQGQLLQKLQWLAQHRTMAVQTELERLLTAYRLSHSELEEAIEHLVSEQTGKAQTNVGTDGEEGTTAMSLEGSDPWSRMLDWMRRHGGTVNAAIQYASPTSGRVVVATRELRRGDMIAAIPLQLMFSLQTHGGNDTYELAAANLWDAMNDPGHPLQPYFQALPARDELTCPLVDMPQEYIPLLSNKIAESGILEYQQRIYAFWEAYKGQLQSELPDMTLEDLKYARSLIATRVFAHATLGDVLIPLLDMANHQEDCPHIQTLGLCPADHSQDCMLWHAGANLGPGEEVCGFYKTMMNDQTFLQYGFLQANDTRLHNMDRHDFVDAASFWAPSWTDSAAGVSSTAASMEHKRLQSIATALRQAVAQELAPVKGATELMKLMQQWMRLRVDAVVQEIRRVHRLAQS